MNVVNVEYIDVGFCHHDCQEKGVEVFCRWKDFISGHEAFK